MRDFKFTEQERPTMANFNARFDAIAALANGLGNEYVWLRNDGTYVNSPDTNAYPPSVSDGYTYKALGQLGAKVQIATGSYTGTGTYGSSNPNSLTFDFEPKLLFVRANDIGWGAFFVAGANCATSVYRGQFTYGQTSGGLIGCTWSGNTLSWYNLNSADIQLNSGNSRYYYVAIG